MLSYVFAFIFGLIVPLVASRYGKILASDWGEWLFFLWHKPHFPKVKDLKRTALLKQKWKKMLVFCLFWAILLTFLFFVIELYMPVKVHLWIKIFVCLMALMTAIDQQYFLLPDIFTVPLIFFGFGYALWGGIITPTESFVGCCYGFFLPAIAVFVSSRFMRNAFGGGDVKMLAGLGAWVGMLPLCLLLMISVVTFFITALITHRKAGAYGPHLAFAGVIVLFLTVHHVIPFL